MLLRMDDVADVDLSRIIHRAYREADEVGATYDVATSAAIQAVLAVYPDWSRDKAFDQILRLGSGPF